MCGIGGYYRSSDNKNTSSRMKPVVRSLWNNLQERGLDASGIAYESPTGTRTVKRDRPSYEMSTLGTNLAFGMNRTPRWIMLHTRAATHGKPELNRNNHPLMAKGLALCHNGVVYNKKDVLERYNIDAKREVDTEAILIALKKGGINAVSKYVSGSMSLSWGKGKNMYLWTNGKSPLVIGELFNGDYMYASTDKLLMSTNLQFKKVFTAKKGHLYRFTPKGMFVNRTYFKEEKTNHAQLSWRDFSSASCTPKIVRKPYLVPSIDFSMPEEKADYAQAEDDVAYLDDIDVEWEAVYGDWRSWSKKSKELRQ